MDRMLNNKALAGIDKYQSEISRMLNNTALAGIDKYQSEISRMLNNTALAGINKYQSEISRMLNNTALAGINKYQSEISRMLNNTALAGIDKYQSEISRMLNNTALAGIGKYQSEMSNLVKKHLSATFTVDSGLKLQSYNDLIEKLELLSDEIDIEEEKVDEHTNSKEKNVNLKSLIDVMKEFSQFYNIINPNLIWGILEKVAVLVTLYSLFDSEDPNERQDINIYINGNNNQIEIKEIRFEQNSTNNKSSKENQNQPKKIEENENIKNIDLSSGEKI